jgi:sterol desaturase/sphingolipid hydroxylase (fatty acid hydroxylase superfamily)
MYNPTGGSRSYGHWRIYMLFSFWSVAQITGKLIFVHNVTGFIFHSFYFTLDRFRLLQKYKINANKKPEGALTRKAFSLYLFDSFVLLPLLAGFVFAPLMLYRGLESHSPGIFLFIFQTTLSLFITDAVFYCSHRLLHHKTLYQTIHKHHHEFTTTSSISSEYSHPIESLINAISGILRS